MRAVIFDLGHTLIDYYNDFRVPEDRAVNRFFEVASKRKDGLDHDQFCGTIIEELENARTRRRNEMIEIALIEFLNDRLLEFNVPNDDGLIEEGLDIFYDALLEHRRLIPGSIETLQKLKNDHMLVGLISDVAWGLPSSFPLRDMRHYGMDRFFDDMVFSTDVGLRKPNRRIFEISMERLGVTPDESIYIGNNLQADIAGALGAGMKAILKKSSYFTPDDSIVPSARVDGWSELEAVLEGL
jgi:putative hydrolase of the HAD superfamily